MSFATVGDLQIYYEIRGKGPRLFTISGTGSDLRRAPTIFDRPVAKHFEVLAYDHRGLGQSSRPDKRYTMADFADDADGLLEALGWGPCPVMGTSFGGMVAQEFAVRHPQRVTRLVLNCSSSGGKGGSSYPLHEFEALPEAEAQRRHLEISDTRRDAAWQAANAAEFRKLLDDAAARARIGADEPGRKMGAHRQLEARSYHDTWERLPSLKMPVLICGGRYDGIASPANLEAMHGQVPGSQLALFEGGHQFHVQDPAAWARIIPFLQGKPG